MILVLFVLYVILGIFHLKYSAIFETLNSTHSNIHLFNLFLPPFHKNQGNFSHSDRHHHEHHCLVWVTPAVVVLECLSLTGSISSLVTGCWPVIGQLRLTLRPDWLSPGDCLMPDRGCLEKLTAWRQRESTESTSSLGEHQGTTDGQRWQYNSLIDATN